MDNNNLTEQISIEIVCAFPDKQKILKCILSNKTSVREAVVRSNMNKYFNHLDLLTCPLGIFGKIVSAPDQRLLKDGDRIEIYRSLIADPKLARKQRADKLIGVK